MKTSQNAPGWLIKPLIIRAVLLVFFLPGALAYAAEQKKPLIESIEGDKIVVIKTAAGQNTVGQAGTEVNVGDRIKTGPRASAKIRYPDGSKLLIGQATEMEIQEAANGTQFNQLHQGEVRGIIRKPKVIIPGASPRFVVRSKAAVMGVRGTDFVFGLNDAATQSEVHTLEGTVEVAKDEPALFKGEGVKVTENQMVTADLKSGLKGVSEFDRRLYDKILDASQPQFAALQKNDADIKSMAEAPTLLNPEVAEKSSVSRIRLLQFRGNAMFARQDSGGESLSPELSWNPVIDLIWPISIRGHLGGFVLKGKTRDDKFLGIEAGALVSLSLLSPLIIEAGAGVESWGDHAKAGPVVMGNVGWRLSETSFLERLFVGLSIYDAKIQSTSTYNSYTSSNMTVQVKAGIGVQL